MGSRISFSAVVLSLAVTCWVGHARAQTVVSAQTSSISAAGSTVTALRVPVQVGSGAPKYFDVTITLTPHLSGSTPTSITAAATSVASQLIRSNGFIAGNYIAADGSKYTLGGPGAGSGGATTWSLQENPAQGTCYLVGATWDTDISSNNPEYPRLKKDGITTNAYSFGVSGSNACAFLNGSLIGAVQSGRTLTVSLFTVSGVDYTTPQDSIVLNLQ